MKVSDVRLESNDTLFNPAPHSNYIGGFDNRWQETPVEPGDSIRWGDWDEDNTGGAWRLIGYASGSDYGSSCLVEVVNHAIICDKFPDEVIRIYGGYNTFGVAVRQDSENEEIIEILEGLATYPLIDDEALTEKEMEAADETWTACYESDCLRELEDGLEIADGKEGAFREAFELAGDGDGCYWENESAGNMYIDVERIAKRMDLEKLLTDGILERG